MLTVDWYMHIPYIEKKSKSSKVEVYGCHQTTKNTHAFKGRRMGLHFLQSTLKQYWCAHMYFERVEDCSPRSAGHTQISLYSDYIKCELSNLSWDMAATSSTDLFFILTYFKIKKHVSTHTGKHFCACVFSVWEVINDCSDVSVSGRRALSKLLSHRESDLR